MDFVKRLSFWMESLGLMLLMFYLLYVAEGSLEPNHTTTQPPLSLKRQRGRIHSSLLAGQLKKRKLNIDIEGKSGNTKKLHGNVIIKSSRKGNNAYDNTIKKQQLVFQAKRKSNIDIQEKPRHVKKLQERNDLKSSKHIKTTKKYVFQGKRKSLINIQGQQAKSPVMYTSHDGQDHYLTVRIKQHPHRTQINPNLPSKTFLVTVYGDQIEGAEEKLRNALMESQPKKCPCKCGSTPCKQAEEACPCDETTHETHENHAVSLHAGGQKLILFPNVGKPFGRSGCICPCCLCSCSKPGHENYNCGCQNSPPVPCPCDWTMNSGIQPLKSSSVGSNPSPVYAGTSGIATANQVASWTGGTSPCPCPCCPCACAQSQTYPNYQCGCASQSPAPCPCNNQGWNFDQSGADNNVARSPEISPYTTSAPTYIALQSPANSPYTPSVPANSGPAVQTFRSGDYQVESSCDCYCCPCSCPETEYSGYENTQCTCGQDTQAGCTCRRSEVRNQN